MKEIRTIKEQDRSNEIAKQSNKAMTPWNNELT
jgi:hypothetical protein